MYYVTAGEDWDKRDGPVGSGVHLTLVAGGTNAPLPS
jgi:hypothetical protein